MRPNIALSKWIVPTMLRPKKVEIVWHHYPAYMFKLTGPKADGLASS